MEFPVNRPSKDETLGLFAGLPRRYDLAGALLSFGQDPRWRRAMVARVPPRAISVLDVATGTGMVAAALVRRYGCRVVGLDQSPEMLAGAQARLDAEPGSPRASSWSAARRSRCRSRTVSSTTSPSLICSDTSMTPAATLRELARVVKPGGRIASLEFMLPPNAIARALWRIYTRVGLPVLGRLISRDWYEVGRFLGPSITGPLPATAARSPAGALASGRHRGRAGAGDEPGWRRRDLGGPWLTRTASNAPPSTRCVAGGWRDLVTVLHPPYTAWNLANVGFGAAAATQIHTDRFVATLAPSSWRSGSAPTPSTSSTAGP